MRKFNLLLWLLISLFFSCSSISLQKGEAKEMTLREGDSLTLDGLKISCGQFTEVFTQAYNPELKRNIHSSKTIFNLSLEKDGVKKEYPQIAYGTLIRYMNYEIKVTWCAIGTRDFSSHAKLKITKISEI